MKITIDDNTMKARAVDTAENGRMLSVWFDVFEDDTVEHLISRATDELSMVYLDMCSPLM